LKAGVAENAANRNQLALKTNIAKAIDRIEKAPIIRTYILL
jgi:hypothetical protein